MKNFAILAALAVMTLTAPAASLTWGYGGGYLFVSKSGDTSAVQANTFTDDIPDGSAFVLVYLGSSSTLDVSSVTDADVVDRITYAFEFDGTDSYANPQDKQFTVSESKYNVGDYFGIAFYNGSAYSSFYGVTDYDEGTIGSTLSPVVQITDLDGKASFSVYASDGGPTDAYDYHMAGVTVPEPSTAMLALAGLALLIKRRRA